MKQNEIIRGCQQGHEESYRELVRLYSGFLMGVCVRYLRDRQKAEDALQETYILAFRSIHRLNEDATLKAWLCRIAINCCLKELRDNKNLRFNTEDVLAENIPDLPGIYEQLEAEDLLKILDLLPEHYRVIFNLNVIEGYSHREISEILDIRESLSRTKLTRARKMLQDYYTLHFHKSVV